MLQELLHHPMLATTRTGDAWVPWQVYQPVGRAHPRETEILEPRNGDVLIALQDTVSLIPKVFAVGDGAVLFLNGAPVALGAMALSPGQHELRLVEPGFAPHVVHFIVKTAG
jgi:hypothetical protein